MILSLSSFAAAASGNCRGGIDGGCKHLNSQTYYCRGGAWILSLNRQVYCSYCGSADADYCRATAPAAQAYTTAATPIQAYNTTLNVSATFHPQGNTTTATNTVTTTIFNPWIRAVTTTYKTTTSTLSKHVTSSAVTASSYTKTTIVPSQAASATIAKTDKSSPAGYSIMPVKSKNCIGGIQGTCRRINSQTYYCRSGAWVLAPNKHAYCAYCGDLDAAYCNT